MPELPEVETIKLAIKPVLLGQTIINIKVRNKKLRLPVNDNIINICNKTILSVQRRAKYLLLELNKGWIIIHFGMSGSLLVYNTYQKPNKHDHINLIINNGYTICYRDPRRFGVFLWSHDLINNKLLSGLGPEPLSKKFDTNWLYNKCRNKCSTIKQILMNNKIVVGIGNIYANESLFIAKILPQRKANSLNKNNIKILVKSIKILLINAIKQGGTSLNNFIHIDGSNGNFKSHLQVYGKENKYCQNCKKTIIVLIRINQRSSFFCPKCQH